MSSIIKYAVKVSGHGGTGSSSDYSYSKNHNFVKVIGEFQKQCVASGAINDAKKTRHIQKSQRLREKRKAAIRSLKSRNRKIRKIYG